MEPIGMFLDVLVESPYFVTITLVIVIAAVVVVIERIIARWLRKL